MNVTTVELVRVQTLYAKAILPEYITDIIVEKGGTDAHGARRPRLTAEMGYRWESGETPGQKGYPEDYTDVRTWRLKIFRNEEVANAVHEILSVFNCRTKTSLSSNLVRVPAGRDGRTVRCQELQS